jgi:hypothetical protein
MQEDQEKVNFSLKKIKQKRLERLAQIEMDFRSVNAAVNGANVVQSAPLKDATTTIKPVKLSMNNNEAPLSKIQITPTSANTHTRIMTEDEWETNLCHKALQVSLNPEQKGYLSLLVDELKEESVPLVMTKNNWERILYSSILAKPNTFDYLKTAWLKLQEWKKRESFSRQEKMTELSNLILNYMGLVLNPETVDMFPSNEHGAGYLGHRLVVCQDFETEYPRHLVDAIIQNIKEDGLREMVNSTVNSILDILNTKRIYDDYQPCFRAFQYLLTFKDIALLVNIYLIRFLNWIIGSQVSAPEMTLRICQY